MDTERTRALAVSRAGHDKGRLYLILEEKDGMCALTDGRIRTLDRPKKKKSMHLQKIIHLPQELRMQMEKAETDAEVRAVLRQYQNRLNQEISS